MRSELACSPAGVASPSVPWHIATVRLSRPRVLLRVALLAVGGGVSVPLSAHLALDLGYRYMRIFTDDPRINTGTMSAGIRWGF